MRKPGKHTYRLLCLILVLVGLMIGVTLAPEPAGRASAQVLRTGWALTGSLNTPRGLNTATLLPNGKVLVAGGVTCGFDYLGSAELYDPATNTWSYTGSLNVPRRGHTATLLPNGKVLVAGGEWGTDQFLIDAELYDPATGTWSLTQGINFPRFEHSAVLLANGKVLVAGGVAGELGERRRSVEIYDPATGKWNVTGSLNTVPEVETATLLANGKVLVTGDYRAEAYDPDTGTWSPARTPTIVGYYYTATLLPNGKVLGNGVSGGGHFTELYDPTSGTWNSTGAPIAGGRTILLPNGKVLASYLYSAEFYDPANGSWGSPTNSNINLGFATPTLLPNGTVLFASSGNSCAPDKAALLDYGLVQSGTVTSVSAASYSLMGLASEAIASSFGTALANTTTGVAALPLPTQLAGTTVKIKDSAGDDRLAPLFFVSPTQVNYQIPTGTAPGAATITITSANGTVSTGVAIVHAVAPSLFAANGDGQGVAAAFVLRVRADGSQGYEPVAQFDAAENKFVARAIDLGPATDQVYLVLFGTGLRHHSSLSSVIASLGGAYAEVSYAGAQPDLVGLDQVNVLLPRSLAGRGEVEILLTVEAKMANPVRIIVK